jgi:hypothetical protein
MRLRVVAVGVLSIAAFLAGLSLGPPARRRFDAPAPPARPAPRPKALEEAWRAMDASDAAAALRALASVEPTLPPVRAAERAFLEAWARGSDDDLLAASRRPVNPAAAAAAERLLVLRAASPEQRRERGEAFASRWPASWWAKAARAP